MMHGLKGTIMIISYPSPYQANQKSIQNFFNFPNSTSEIRHIKKPSHTDRITSVEGEEDISDRIFPIENFTKPHKFDKNAPIHVKQNTFYSNRVFFFTPNASNLRKYQFQILFQSQFPSHILHQHKRSSDSHFPHHYLLNNFSYTPYYTPPSYPPVFEKRKNPDLICRIMQSISCTWKSTLTSISTWIQRLLSNIKMLLNT